MIYSTNQNRQFYVANGTAVTEKDEKTGVFKFTKAGDYAVMKDKDETEVCIAVKGVDSILRTDIVKFDQILSSNITDVSELAKGYSIVAKYSDMPASGDELIAKFVVREAYAKDSNSKAAFYATATKIADLKEEAEKVFEKNGLGKIVTFTTSELKFTPAVKDWKRGLSGGEAQYDMTVELFADGKRVSAEIERVEETKVLNPAHILADLELFCYSERAVWTKFENVYAGVGAPELLIDPKSDAYNDLKIQTVQYYFVNPNGHRSVKEIQLLVTDEIASFKKTKR